VDCRGIPWEPVYRVWQPFPPFLLIIRLVDARPRTPSHIHTIYRPSDPMKKLIARKVRKKSNELEILKPLPPSRSPIMLSRWSVRSKGSPGSGAFYSKWRASRIMSSLLLKNLKARSFKCVWASLRVSHISTSSVSLTRISSRETFVLAWK
jgi:hypothetical protein